MLHRDRAAKIISTLGPSSSSKGQIRELFRAGADDFRLNFSNGTHKEQAERYHLIRELEIEVGTPIGVIMDLQGLNIRVQTFKNGSAKLKRGSSFKLDSQSQIQGTSLRVAISNPEIFGVVEPGMELLLDMGK